MVKLQIILGSTRPNRVGKGVADWVYEQAQQRSDIEVELVDIADYDLPLLDEPRPPSTGNYTQAHTKKWAAKIAEADGYIFVTAEYNHSVPGALKNAIDFLYAEWNNKAAGIVSYGAAASGARAAEHLRGVLGEIQIADVREQLLLSLINDFEGYTTFRPTQQHGAQLTKVLDQTVKWSAALTTVRSATSKA